jgi:2-polyprenyl-6-methoxyphenol hydroxylase-like FAD-dependent oxidoreductase
MPETQRYDVAVIGCGPSGLTAAALLASRGWSVIALEKHPRRYGLPRASHLDHEIVRIVQEVGAHEPIFEDNDAFSSYRWYGANGQLLFELPISDTSISGFQSNFIIFQPVLDGALYDALERVPTATVELGAEVTALDATADGVTLTVVQAGDTFTVEAAYVIAADGAGSSVRDRILQIPREDFGFNEKWLDIDSRVKRPLPREIYGQYCDPSRPAYIGPLGRRHFRFECALLADETEEEVLRPENVWEVLGRYGVGPDDIEPIRQIVYTFEARIAERWRDGRVFLVGDAAHTMPPFMGQGMCSGIRDASNLAWKLDLVLRGVAGDSLLDSYEAERRPHATTWIESSLAVGRVSQVLDPVVAAERDAKILAGEMPPPPESPTLTAGVLQLESDGSARPPVGGLFVQAPIESATGDGLLHDVVGHGFLVVSVAGDPRAAIDADAEGALQAIGATVIWLGDAGPGAFRDPTGATQAFCDEAGAAAMVVRPDHYIAGAVRDLSELSPLVVDLASKMSVRDQHVVGARGAHEAVDKR